MITGGLFFRDENPVSKPVGDDVRRLKYPAPKFLVRVSSPRLLQIEGSRADRELSQLAAGGMTRDG